MTKYTFCYMHQKWPAASMEAARQVRRYSYERLGRHLNVGLDTARKLCKSPKWVRGPLPQTADAAKAFMEDVARGEGRSLAQWLDMHEPKESGVMQAAPDSEDE